MADVLAVFSDALAVGGSLYFAGFVAWPWVHARREARDG